MKSGREKRSVLEGMSVKERKNKIVEKSDSIQR